MAGDDREEDEAVQQSSNPVPPIARAIMTDFGRRHVKGVAVTRLLAAICCVAVGSFFLVTGHWWGAFLFVAAAVNGVVVYLMPRWRLALDAENNAHRVVELERSRALVVDEAAARLRRIEQDLHDGAQAQMVAVVMKLGLAREQLDSAAVGPEPGDLERARKLVDAAHQGAMEAIAELRDLARGIHPPALSEGLGAALAALVERSELPVQLSVRLPERPSAAIETIAYFCVAELLTNVAKHSAAQHVTVQATCQTGLVRIAVSDDGRGGARAETGGGLAGLAERVHTVDGRLKLTSPTGGPTVVTVELPFRTEPNRGLT
jgi:signal transduction histidine kinase